MMRLHWLTMIVLGLVFLFSSAALAQTATGSITGTARDTSGAVVPNATVTIKHLESGLTRTAETDANGNYSVPSLPVGQYEVTSEKEGFKQQVRRGITLVVGQQAVVNMTLEVGNVAQQVTVTAEAPLVNTTLSSTSGLVGEKEVKDLPLNGRSFDQLLTLNVGTTNYTSNSRFRGSVFSVAGRRPETNRFLMNGVDYV
ncbi:MAG: carboxypeptidase regulatory-like domain-containing protein, partial [Acidobacteria bacterium]|nr:carboxypeptidase regulatory-like domain-containing protein [Acidobacteriota bacterium]